MLPSVRPLARPWTAGLHGSSRSGSRSRRRTRGTVLQPGCPDPVSPTVAPCPPSARPTPRWPRRIYAATAGALYVPPLTSRAQTMRAVLLARATVTSIRGLRGSRRATLAGPPHHGAGAQDEQAADGPLAHLRDGPELALAAGRLLQRRQPEPGGEVPPGAEALRRRHQGGDRGSRDGADAGDRHEPPRHGVGLGAPGDLSIQ